MVAQLRVYSACYYLTELGGWRDTDYTAHDIVKIAKGEPFGGYFDFRVNRTIRRFDHASANNFLPVLYEHMAKRCLEVIAAPCTLVPIPNSAATAADASTFRTLDLANGIANAMGGDHNAQGALRWYRQKLKAHENGLRDPAVHFRNLRIVDTPRNPVVLFDDVFTSGSQITAAARKLTAAGHAPLCAFVIGTTTHDRRPNMVEWSEFTIDIK